MLACYAISDKITILTKFFVVSYLHFNYLLFCLHAFDIIKQTFSIHIKVIEK